MKLVHGFLVKDKINHLDLWHTYFSNADDNMYDVIVHASNVNFNRNNPDGYTIASMVPTTWEQTMKAHFSIYKEFIKIKDAGKLVMLSESCIPIVPLRSAYATLMTNLDEAYFNILAAPWWRSSERITHPDVYSHLIGHEQWTCLTRRQIEILLENEHKIYSWFGNCFADNELFSGTSLKILAPNEKLVLKKYHYISRIPSRPQPPESFCELLDYEIDRLVKDGFIFARKFPMCANLQNLHSHITA